MKLKIFESDHSRPATVGPQVLRRGQRGSPTTHHHPLRIQYRSYLFHILHLLHLLHLFHYVHHLQSPSTHLYSAHINFRIKNKKQRFYNETTVSPPPSCPLPFSLPSSPSSPSAYSRKFYRSLTKLEIIKQEIIYWSPTFCVGGTLTLTPHMLVSFTRREGRAEERRGERRGKRRGKRRERV